MLNQRFDSKFQELSNPVISQTDCMKSGDIVQQELRVRLISISLLPCRNAHPLATPGFRVPKINR